MVAESEGLMRSCACRGTWPWPHRYGLRPGWLKEEIQHARKVRSFPLDAVAELTGGGRARRGHPSRGRAGRPAPLIAGRRVRAGRPGRRGQRRADRLDRGRHAARPARRGRQPVPGRPLRRTARRGAALAGAPAGPALVRRPGRHLLWPPLSPAGQRQRPPGGHRGLPVPQRLLPGGGLLNGAGDQHDGSLIVRTDHIIVVSLNYRLGVFGFLDVPGLGTSALTANGNFGLLDQEAALRWVHRNIAQFGGNPGQVTIAGESAGGWSVCALMTSPLARGLFRGAISESGSCPSQTPAQAQSAGVAFAAQAGCTDAAAAASCLRNTPEPALLTASASYSAQFTSGGPDLPLPPLAAVADGDYAKVPLLMGTNHDEGRTFTQGFASYTEQQYVQFVDQSYGALAPAILQRYPWSAYPSPYTASYAIGAIWTDSGFVDGIGGCPTQNLAAKFARRTPTFFYQFDDRHAPA